MANYNGSLEAVDCHIRSVRYDMVLESRAGGRLKCLIRSPTRCSDADTTSKSVSREKDASIYTIMANYNGSLEAVDCHIRSVRNDMVLESRAGGRLRCLIRSPTRCSDADTTSKSRVELAVVSDASSGHLRHLRRCSDVDTTSKSLSREKDASILSWPTIMGH
eukprot:scaffold11956_cov89-Skeletonema_marinoi.AAC.1